MKKAILIIVCVIIVLAVVFGFDFSIYELEDLSTYPDLDFGEAVNGLTEASSASISSIFGILGDVSKTAMSAIRWVANMDVPDDWTSDQLYLYTKLEEIRDEMSYFDKCRLAWVKAGILNESVLDDLYLKYYNRSGEGLV